MHFVGRFYRNVVEAIPLPVFLVDDQLHIYRLNQAAIDLSWLDPAALLREQGKEILQCLLHADSKEGCGQGASCADCVVRNSALECLAGGTVCRHNIKFEATISGMKREMRVTVTVAPIPDEDGNVVLMVLEDMMAVTQLKEFIPICMCCKKIRDDEQYWQDIESYFTRCVGANFSHGICPACRQKHYT